jgi:hypothetical protein
MGGGGVGGLVGKGGTSLPLPGLKGLCGCRRDGFRAVSVARVPHPELDVPGGPRVNGEVGAEVPRAEVPGVGGVRSAACRRPSGGRSVSTLTARRRCRRDPPPPPPMCMSMSTHPRHVQGGCQIRLVILAIKKSVSLSTAMSICHVFGKKRERGQDRWACGPISPTTRPVSRYRLWCRVPCAVVLTQSRTRRAACVTARRLTSPRVRPQVFVRPLRPITRRRHLRYRRRLRAAGAARAALARGAAGLARGGGAGGRAP